MIHVYNSHTYYPKYTNNIHANFFRYLLLYMKPDKIRSTYLHLVLHTFHNRTINFKPTFCNAKLLCL